MTDVIDLPWLAVAILYAAIVSLAIVARGVYEVACPPRRRPARPWRWLVATAILAAVAGFAVGTGR